MNRKYLLIVPVVFFLIVFFVAPIGWFFQLGFYRTGPFFQIVEEFTIDNYLRIFTERYIKLALNTILLVALVVAIDFVIGYPAAYALVKTKSKAFRSLLYAIVISPLLCSSIVRAFGWVAILSRKGLVNYLLMSLGLINDPANFLYKFETVVLAQSHVLAPFMILPIASALQSIDPSIKLAARSLGATRLRTFLRITLPLSSPGIVAGISIISMLTMGVYVTPLLVGGFMQPLLAVQIYNTIMGGSFDFPQASAYSFMLIALSVIFTAILTRTIERVMR